MMLFMFKSEKGTGLHAFTEDRSGAVVPSRHGPWLAVGVVREDGAPPHAMSRESIEGGIALHGFQLWRKLQPKSGSTGADK